MTEPAEKELNPVNLSIESITSTGVCLKLSSNAKGLIRIMRDDKVIKEIDFTPDDTLIYDESLQPNTSYLYQALRYENGRMVPYCMVTAVTMDTTSHDFTWQSWTFGVVGDSRFEDVHIVDENNIWAVGDIFLADSTGQPDLNNYGLAHFDGKQWKFIRLYFKIPEGTILASNFRDILYLGSNDIWFAAGSIFHWDGVSSYVQLKYSCLDLHDPLAIIEKIWGNSKVMYGVGTRGSIVYNNGTGWQRLQSGTESRIYAIQGEVDSKTSQLQLLAAASSNIPMNREILEIKGKEVKKLSTAPIQWELTGLWFKPHQKYFVAGDEGIFEKYSLNENKWKPVMPDISRHTIIRITGKDSNDIFASAVSGELFHFNGLSWKSYPPNGNQRTGYIGMDMKDNLVVAVGVAGRKALITIGRR